MKQTVSTLFLCFLLIGNYVKAKMLCGFFKPIGNANSVTSKDQIANPLYDKNKQIDRLQIQDYSGKPLKEIELTKPVDKIVTIDGMSFDQGFIAIRDRNIFYVTDKGETEEALGSLLPLAKDQTETVYAPRSDQSRIFQVFQGVYNKKNDKEFELSQRSTRAIFDLENKEKLTYDSKYDSSVAYHNTVVLANSDELEIRDLKTGQTFKIPIPKNYRYVSLNNDSIIELHPIPTKKSDNGANSNENKLSPAYLIRAKDKWHTFGTNIKAKDSTQYMPSGHLADGRFLMTKEIATKPNVSRASLDDKDFKYETSIYDIEGNLQEVIPNNVYSITGQDIIVKTNNLNGKNINIYKFNSLNKNKLSEALKESHPVANFDSLTANWQSKYAFAKHSEQPNKATLVNLETFATTEINGPSFTAIGSIEESEDRNRYSIPTSNNNVIYDKKTGTLKLIPSRNNVLNANFDKSYLVSNKGEFLVYDTSPNTGCFEEIEVIEDICDPLTKKSSKTANLDPSALQNISVKLLCDSSSFNSAEWDKLTPEPKPNQKISETEAIQFLNRFTKPGGFDRQKHMGILLGILDSPIVEKTEASIQTPLRGALSTIAMNDDNLVTLLYMKLNLKDRIPITKKGTDPACRSKQEAEEVKKYVNAEFERIQRAKIDYNDVVSLLPFQQEMNAKLKELSPAEQSAVIDKTAEGLLSYNYSDPNVNGVYYNQIYYFSKKAVLPIFGIQPKKGSDLSVKQKNGKLEAIALGSHNIEGADTEYSEAVYPAAKMPNGFSIKRFKPLEVNTDQIGVTKKANYSWVHDGQLYTSDLSLNVGKPLAEFVPNGKSLPYEEMKTDGFEGVIAIGANLADSPGLTDAFKNYLAYPQSEQFKNNTFKIEAPVKVNYYDYLKTKVKDKKTDFFLKQAHSDGDGRNLLEVPLKGLVYKATRTYKGSKQVVNILVPEPVLVKSKDGEKLSLPKETRRITNAEYGSWIKERKGKSFAYLNTSCNSTYKVAQEMAAVQSKDYYPIASDSYVDTMDPYVKEVNGVPQNGTALIIENILNYGDNEAMKKKLETYPKYNDNSVDVLIGWDDPRFKEKVIGDPKKPSLNFEAHVYKGSGANRKEVYPDELVDHD